MTTPQNYSSATLLELTAALRARHVGALELVDSAIRAIEVGDLDINAVPVRDFDRARDAAKAADAASLADRERRGLLGVPLTVKESLAVEGLPTTWGIRPMRDAIAVSDATAVANLKRAGAIILGKSNVAPDLRDWQTQNPIYGRTNNPFDRSRTPGGSSGGAAAAVAARMTPLEVGSDIGGSIRVPASFCGVFGHKPSYGLVSQHGHSVGGQACAPAIFNVVGPLARSSADLELALDILSAPDELEGWGLAKQSRPARHQKLKDFRILCLDAHPVAALDHAIARTLDQLATDLQRLGATVGRRWPSTVDLASSFQAYVELLRPAQTRENYDANALDLPEKGPPLTAHQWLAGLDVQQRTRQCWAALFQQWDIVLAPCFGTAAFHHLTGPWKDRTLHIDGQATPYGRQVAWPAIASFGCLPATAFPVDFTAGGLPIGLQAIGPFLEDRTTLAFVRLLEMEQLIRSRAPMGHGG
jgi:amidase